MRYHLPQCGVSKRVKRGLLHTAALGTNAHASGHGFDRPLDVCGQDAVNFAVFSSAASFLALCLFTEGDLEAGRMTTCVRLDPQLNRTGDVWHIMLPQLDPSLLYGTLPLAK